MPCACQIPVPNYPDTADWGPILWKILHGLAEKAQQSLINADEVRQWQKLITSTGVFLPCEHCRQHFKQYSLKYPITNITTIPFTQIKQWIKTWLLNLHNEINASATPRKPEFTYDALEAEYSRVDITDLLYQLTPVVKKAISLSGLPIMAWTTWVFNLKMLRATLGV